MDWRITLTWLAMIFVGIGIYFLPVARLIETFAD
jgi:hypothetical protein